jgi:hypothetical protein
MRSNHQTTFLRSHALNAQQSHQQSSDMEELKNMMKSLFEQIRIMLNLLTAVFTKLKQRLSSYNLPYGT